MSGETVITIVGNLTDDPELRFLPSGVSCAKFTVASTPRVMDKRANEWKDGDPLFMNCTVWRQAAEHVAESLKKGSRVIVTGRLTLQRWEDKETGQPRSAFHLEVDEIGPSLRFATATVQKMARTKALGDGSHFAGDDEWASATTQRPAMAAA